MPASTVGDTAPALADELQRVLQVVESALLVEEPALIEEHVEWLRDTGPAHGFERALVDAALAALAAAMNGDLQRAGSALRAALTEITHVHRVACHGPCRSWAARRTRSFARPLRMRLLTVPSGSSSIRATVR